MLRFLWAWLWLVMAPFACLAQADQAGGRRVALVFGSGDYTVAGQLPNATRDGQSFAHFVQENGFETQLVLNATRSQMASALATFTRKLGPDDTALFYYAGHGMQLRGENYLVGVDAQLQSEFDVAAETLALTDIMTAIESRTKVALFFIDACRNNPLADRLNIQVQGASRGIATRGLAPVETHNAGTMVAFAAAPGQVALDGEGSNSPFTGALIANLSGDNLEIGTAFKRVIRDVREKTKGRQSPQLLSSLSLEFYFSLKIGKEEPAQAPPAAPPATPSAPAAPSAERALTAAETDFRKVLRLNLARTWRSFIDLYPGTEQASLARDMLFQLEPPDTGFKGDWKLRFEEKIVPTAWARTKVKAALAEKGFKLAISGAAFDKTARDAIAAYQKSVELSDSGFLNEPTVRKLGLLDLVQRPDGAYTKLIARSYAPSDFVGFETDALILKAIACNPLLPKIFGGFQGHIYVVVKRQFTSFDTARTASEQCGGHLATINSAEENRFVASLFQGDPTLVKDEYFAPYSEIKGPWIGLVQDPQGKEPRGGWKWITGEPMTFTNWGSDFPNEHKPGDDYGMYYANWKSKTKPAGVFVDTWDDMGPSNSAHSYIIEFE